MNKPSSKVIQISSASTASEGASSYYILTALCEDGSVWESYQGKWICLLEAPAQPKSDLPEVGSRWNSVIYGPEIEIEKVEDGRVYPKGYSSVALRSFLKCYEPIPTQSDNKE